MDAEIFAMLIPTVAEKKICGRAADAALPPLEPHRAKRQFLLSKKLDNRLQLMTRFCKQVLSLY